MEGGDEGEPRKAGPLARLPLPTRELAEILENVRPGGDDRRAYFTDAPTAFDEKRCNAIIELVRRGHSPNTAVRSCGISRESFREWRRKFREGEPSAEKLRWFFEALDIAGAQAEVLILEEMRASPPGTWQKHAWWLERTRPELYAQKPYGALAAARRQEGALEPPKPVDQMTAEELDAWQQSLASGEADAEQKRRKR